MIKHVRAFKWRNVWRLFVASNIFDLQIQSTASDGKHSPRDLVKMAKELGLQTIAITDHDTVGGIAEALMAGGEFGIRVIPGIEMSVEEHNAHILGYGIDYKNQRLLEELEKFRQGRIEGARAMMENLKKNEGFVMEWEDVLKEATGSVVARPHLVRAIMNRPENKEKLGGISSMHDFFAKYLLDDNPNYVKRTHISVKDAIALIRAAGGVAVWSHPVIHFRGKESRGGEHISPTDFDALEKFLSELISWGILGIEVFNPSHTEDDMEFLQGFATKYNLLRTAGSDFHEKGDHPADPVSGLHSARTLGDYETHGFLTDDIVSKLDEVMKK